MNSYLEQNLSLLRKTQPDLAEQVHQYIPYSKICLVDSRDNMPGLVVLDEQGQETVLNSRYHPLREAERLAASYPVDGKVCYVALGMGLGYHLLRYLPRIKALNLFLILEKDMNVFRRAMEGVDFTPLLSTGKTHFCVGSDERIYKRAIDGRIAHFLINGCRLLEHPPTLARDPAWYETARNYVTDFARLNVTEVATNATNGRLFQRNVLTNLPEFFSSPGVERLYNLFAGRPAIVVSAGPSLDKNVNLLREAKGRAVIICVDTAVRMLLKRGISPDLVVSIDPLDLTLKHFDGIKSMPKEVCLIFDPEVEPRTPVRFPWRRFIISISKLNLLRELEQEIGAKGTLRKGGTVAHAAFYVARAAGAEPIVFIGQDLCYDPDLGRTHGDGAALGGRVSLDPEDPDYLMLPVPTRPDCYNRVKAIWVPGVNKERVPTVPNMFAYLRVLEREIAETPNTCIDATEGGARIQGTKVMTLREVLDTFCRETWDIQGAITSRYNIASPEILARGRALTERLVHSLEEGQELARQCANRAGEILEDLRLNKGLTPKGRNQADRCVELEKKLDEIPYLKHTLMPCMQVAFLSLMQHRVKAQQSHSLEDSIALFECQERYYRELMDTCDYLLPAARFALDRMERLVEAFSRPASVMGEAALAVAGAES